MLSAIVEGAAANAVFYRGGGCLRQQVDVTCNPNNEKRMNFSFSPREVREMFSHGVITFDCTRLESNLDTLVVGPKGVLGGARLGRPEKRTFAQYSSYVGSTQNTPEFPGSSGSYVNEEVVS